MFVRDTHRKIPDYSSFEGMNFPQLLEAQAKKRPDKIWIVHNDKQISFGEANTIVNNLAGALIKHGMKAGDVCGLLFPNSINYLLLQMAVLRIGAILVPLNTRYRNQELNFMLQYSDARFLFMVGRFLKADFNQILSEIRPHLPGLEKVFIDAANTPQGTLRIDQVFQHKASRQELDQIQKNPAKDTATATVLFTSGSTGQPKGVLMSHQARVWAGIRICERLMISDDDVLLDPLPFCHEFGGFTIPSHSLIAGARLVIMETFDAADVLRLIEKEKGSVIYGVPPMFANLLNAPEINKHDISSLRTGYMSGAPCPVELVRRVQNEMSCDISIAWGMSEVASSAISEYQADPELKASTIGKGIRGTEFKIVDDLRREVPFGTQGEIAVKGKNLFSGYFKNPELTRSVIGEDGFLYTGDLGKMNSDSYITFMGRKTEIIVLSGGFKVYPAEVEEVLYRVPEVSMAAVVGIPDPDPQVGEVVYACIVPKRGSNPSEEKIVMYLKSQLANYKVPHKIMFMESFPVTEGSNKIKKKELTEIIKKSLI